MNYQLINSVNLTAQSEEVIRLNALPEFRRTTEAMRMAFASCQMALQPITTYLSEEQLQRTSLIVGTAYGELEVTKDFLVDFYGSQLARPTLFQNSLHNAILGFLSIQLKIKGPGMTLSNGANTSQDLLEVVPLQFQNSDIDLCLVCNVDSYMEKLKMLVDFNGSKALVKEGVTATLYATKSWTEKKSIPSPTPSNS